MRRLRHAFEPNPWRPLLCRRCGRHGDAFAHIGQQVRFGGIEAEQGDLLESMRAHPSNYDDGGSA